MTERWVADSCALGTAFLWSLSAIAWSFAGRRVGSVAVAASRILLATVIMAGLHWAIHGVPFPWNMEVEPLVLLAASGALGMGLGDICLFRGLLLIGPRLGMLIMAFSPILTALIAWSLAAEGLGPRAIVGIILTVAGVAWVVADPHGQRSWAVQPGHFRQGVLLCLLATLLASVAYVISAVALRGGQRIWTDGPPLPGAERFSGALVRAAAGAAVIWALLPALGRLGPAVRVFADWQALRVVVPGTIVGPVVGVWLSMIALGGAASGVASALIHTSPLMLIPMTYLAYRERPTLRTLLGTAIAIVGVFLLLVRAG